MSSLVLELQREAVDSKVLVSDLLRKALIVARKLKIKEFEKWILLELNGYKDDDIPSYRLLRGEIKSFNSYNGIWCPVIFSKSEYAELLSKRKTAQPLSELEDLIKNFGSSGMIHMGYTHEIVKTIMNGTDMSSPPTLVLSITQIVGIVDVVRNTVLMWSLKLEEDGIIGEDMTFSEKEKTSAKSANHTVIFYGNSSNAQVQIGSKDSSQTIEQGIDLKEIRLFLQALKGAVSEIDFKSNNKKDLDNAIHDIETEISSPNPKSATIKKKLISVKGILENAAAGAGGIGLLKLCDWVISLI